LTLFALMGYNLDMTFKLVLELENGNKVQVETQAEFDFVRKLLASGAPSDLTTSSAASDVKKTPRTATQIDTNELPDDDGEFIKGARKQVGERLIDYAVRVAEETLIGRQFTAKRLVDLMEKAGWTSGASTEHIKVNSVRNAMNKDPRFTSNEGGGVWTFSPNPVDGSIGIGSNYNGHLPANPETEMSHVE
jgi:hypothetical protein